MGQREEVLEYVRANKPQCDGCVAERLNYSHRQIVNDGKITRSKGASVLCKSNKLVNEAVLG
jgi:hypothetical protein